jgi:hypothetical protein
MDVATYTLLCRITFGSIEFCWLLKGPHQQGLSTPPSAFPSVLNLALASQSHNACTVT